MNDPYSDLDSIFGIGQIEKKDFKSNSVSVEVLPLPPKPDNFENWGLSNVLVGETSIQIQGALNPVKTGESKTFTLRIIKKRNKRFFLLKKY